MKNISINLLPKEILEKRKGERVLVMALAGIGVFFVVLGLVYGYNAIRVMNEQADLELLKAENARYAREIARIADFEQNQILVDQREQLIATAIARKYRFSKFLNNISLLVPNEVWLSDLSVKKTGEIEFSGAAIASSSDSRLGQKSVAKWLVHLSEADDIGEVWLTQSTKDSGVAGETGEALPLKPADERDKMTFQTKAVIESLSEDDLSAPAPPNSGGQT